MSVTTVSNSLILGGWVTKVLKNSDKNGEGGGGKVGDSNILTSFILLARQKKTAFWVIFSVRICNVFLIHRLLYWFESFVV